ncbi:MAG TPA: STAS domain-containing protein [Chitinophagaceae bacterium]|jgi:anti-anti-sigma factor
MNVKSNTKEKFHVITISEPSIAANMTEELEKYLLNCLEGDVKSVILNCKDIQMMDDAAAESIVKIQQTFYEQNASFVICELQPAVEATLDKTGLLEIMNTTPTESEAWDIIQMEEIERELMDDDNPDINL